MAKLKITLIILPLLLFLIYQYGLEVFLYGLCAYIQRTKELPPNIEPRFWNYDGEKEGPFTHRFVHIDQTLDGTPTNVTFHYVEVGDRKNPHVAMFHGASETWYQWHHQLDYMKNDFYMVAFDLKLFGQSSKPKSNKMWPELNELGGNYTVQMLGDEIMAALDKIGLKKFHFITFDLGSYCLYRIPAQYPDRIITYTKMQSLVGVQDIKHMPQFKFFQYAPHATAYFMSTVRDQMVRSIYGWPKNALTNARVYRKLPEEELERIIHEYSYPDGNPLGWVSYVNSLSSPFRDAIDHYQNYTMPVFILQGANDPAQPPWYYDGTYETVVEGWAIWPWGMYFPSGPKQITRPVENGKRAVDFFPKAPVALYESVAYSGHFLPLERPDYTSESIRLFLKGKYDEIRKRAEAQPIVEAHSCTFTFGIPSSGCNERDLVDDPMTTAKKEKSEL